MCPTCKGECQTVSTKKEHDTALGSSVAITDYVKLLKERIGTEEISSARYPKSLEANLSESRKLPYKILAERRAHQNRLRYEVYRFSKFRRTLSVESNRTRPELTRARAQIKIFARYITVHKILVAEKEWRLNGVQYEFDGAKT